MMRSTSTAMGKTPVGAKPERLELPPVVLGVAEREVGAAGERGELAPAQRGQPEDARVVRREEARRRDVVVLQHAPARQPGERLGHRRRDREVQDRDVAGRGRRIAERPRLAAHVVVDRRARRGRTRGPARAAGRARARALSPIASPRCAAGTHWLTTIVGPAALPVDAAGPGGRRQGLVERRPEEPLRLEALDRVELLPEVPRHAVIAAARGAASTWSTNAQQRAAEVAAAQALERRVLAGEDALLQRRRRRRRRRRARRRPPGRARRTARRRRPSSRAPPCAPAPAPGSACRTPRRAARRSPRARSRTGRRRRRRSTPSAPRSTRGP